jgi:ABC-2 type transport system ATP-binding protein
METGSIAATGLSKWFGQVIALSDVTFESQAPIIGLLGPNGAGKSTFIKLLVGLIQPSQGSVRVNGQKPFCNLGLLSQLGYCPEHDRFYENLTPLEFLQFLTRLQGADFKESRRKSLEAIACVELMEKSDQPIRTLSHGMRQRLKVAQAIVHGPRFLVLDEPLSGLDPSGRSKMIKLFRDQVKLGTTILVSSHVLHEVEAMTADILLFNRGKLLAQGEVKKIRDLIDAHPHRIALVCDRLRDLGRELLRFDDVARVEIDHGRMIVETRSPDACYSRIGELGATGGFHIQSMVSLDDNLEAVFRYLVK